MADTSTLNLERATVPPDKTPDDSIHYLRKSFVNRASFNIAIWRAGPIGQVGMWSLPGIPGALHPYDVFRLGYIYECPCPSPEFIQYVKEQEEIHGSREFKNLGTYDTFELAVTTGKYEAFREIRNWLKAKPLTKVILTEETKNTIAVMQYVRETTTQA